MKYIFYIILLFFVLACTPSLKKFDTSKLKDVYVIEPGLVYQEYIKKDITTQKSMRRGYNVLTNNISVIHFRSSSVFTIKVFDAFQPKKAIIRYDLEYKITNDSIVLARPLHQDYDIHAEGATKSDFEEYAILLEYTSDYDYLIFKPTQGVLKGLPLNVTHKDQSKFATSHLSVYK